MVRDGDLKSPIDEMTLLITQMLQSSKPGSNRGGGSSLSAMISTLIPVLLLAIVVTGAFLFFRRKYDRVYNARGQRSIVPVEQ